MFVVNHGTDRANEAEVVDVEGEHGEEGQPVHHQRRGHEHFTEVIFLLIFPAFSQNLSFGGGLIQLSFIYLELFSQPKLDIFRGI